MQVTCVVVPYDTQNCISIFDWKNWSTYWDIDSSGDNVSLEETPGTDGEVKCSLHHVGDKRHENVLGFTRLQLQRPNTTFNVYQHHTLRNTCNTCRCFIRMWYYEGVNLQIQLSGDLHCVVWGRRIVRSLHLRREPSHSQGSPPW